MSRPLPLSRSASLSRRAFFLGGTSLAAATLWSSRALGVVKQNVSMGDYPFKIGIASGDPSPSGFVIWTRLAPDPLAGGGMPAEEVQVAWQVCDDEQMNKVVQKGTTVARPQWGHSVHVEVEGLKPDRWYWYQFKVGNETSPVGRGRTTPSLDSSPKSLRFTFASCQHYESGLFTAYEHMAQDDLDLVLHLGDYIYEYGGQDKRVRKHVGPELMTLDDYRNRHAQYKTDEHLQTVHGLFPWIVTWDDHEFSNNCAGPYPEKAGVNIADHLKRRAAAYQAYYEHMPLRRSSLPKGPDMKIYRTIPFGRLAEFSVLDTRQYRTDQPCGDGKKPQCAEALDPQATVMGSEQEAWLFASLVKSPATWNVLAQQIMMARVDREPGEVTAYSMDQWPGYEMNRRRVLDFIAQRKIANPVVLGGDIHSNWANDLVIDWDRKAPVTVASEFVGTSISSSGDGADKNKTTDGILRENPFVKLYNSQRGYVRCEVTPKAWRTDYQVLEYVSKPGSPISTRASFAVEPGKPGVQQA